MARTGRPKAVLTLNDEEREALALWARRPSSPQSLALRSKIVLACAEGRTNGAVAAELGVSSATVGKWRSRFIAKRLKGLADEYRSGAPHTVLDHHVEAVIVKTLTEKPHNATHWSTRGLATSLQMSQTTVARIWKAFALKPWQIDTFKLSTDPLFVDKVKDIVGIYMNPPEHAVVVCVDEKTAVQALDRTQPVLPLLPGTPERIDRSVPDGLAVHVVLDNSSTHKTPSIQRWLLRHPRFEFHFTPTSSSWMNLVEHGSPRSPTNGSAEAPTAASKNSPRRSPSGSGPGTTIPAPTSGTRPQTRSSTASPNIVNESPTQDTSGPAR